MLGEMFPFLSLSHYAPPPTIPPTPTFACPFLQRPPFCYPNLTSHPYPPIPQAHPFTNQPTLLYGQQYPTFSNQPLFYPQPLIALPFPQNYANHHPIIPPPDITPPVLNNPLPPPPPPPPPPRPPPPPPPNPQPSPPPPIPPPLAPPPPKPNPVMPLSAPISSPEPRKEWATDTRPNGRNLGPGRKVVIVDQKSFDINIAGRGTDFLCIIEKSKGRSFSVNMDKEAIQWLCSCMEVYIHSNQNSGRYSSHRQGDRKLVFPIQSNQQGNLWSLEEFASKKSWKILIPEGFERSGWKTFFAAVVDLSSRLGITTENRAKNADFSKNLYPSCGFQWNDDSQ